MSNETKSLHRVIFLNRGEIYEIYVRHIYQSDLYGFIEIEDFIFGDKGQVVVDPGEEKLKNEFNGVTRSYIPMHSVIRIDEVEREGTAKVTEVKGNNVTPFPQLPIGGSPTKEK